MKNQRTTKNENPGNACCTACGLDGGDWVRCAFPLPAHLSPPPLSLGCLSIFRPWLSGFSPFSKGLDDSLPLRIAVFQFNQQVSWLHNCAGRSWEVDWPWSPVDPKQSLPTLARPAALSTACSLRACQDMQRRNRNIFSPRRERKREKLGLSIFGSSSEMLESATREIAVHGKFRLKTHLQIKNW